VYDAAKDRMIIWRGGVEDIRTLPLEQPVWSVSFHDSDDEVVLTPATDERAMRLASSAATVPALALEVESPQRGTSIRVRFRAPAGEGATLELLDVGGRRLDRTIVTADAAGTGTGTLGRGARHPNGVYFVRATGAGVQATRRLVVME
jgi:hypothetical protein